MNARQEIIALANRCGIDTDEDGDIFGSTNGALLVFAGELIKHAAIALRSNGVDDTARLDFMLANDAFAVRCDRGGSNPQYQLMNQNEDEDYHVLHNERRFFATEREAIDEAIGVLASAAGKEG